MPVAAVGQPALLAGDEFGATISDCRLLLQQIPDVEPEASEREARAEAVDQAGAFESDERARQDLGPGSLGELQDHPGAAEPENGGVFSADEDWEK